MISLSKAASKEIRRLQSKSKHRQLELQVRLSVRTGGCAGLYYDIGLNETVESKDTVCDCGDISVVVDPDSLNYINGLMLDFSEDLMGGGFRFHNPNALQTCGCGNSFSLETK